MEKESIKGKKRARKLALQALYQWLMSGHELDEIEAQFRLANDMNKVNSAYFCRLLHGVPQHLNVLEQQFKPFLDRPLPSLNPIELTLLRLGTYELLHHLEIPYRIILDEYISLAREFGAQDSYRYVNGILNGVAKQVRIAEINLGNE